MAIFANGAAVTQVVKPISGTVQGFQVDQQSGELQVLVAWTDDAGDHSRYFNESDLVATA